MADARRGSPYQGLIPYAEDDSEYFFGREKETRLITANLFAAPLTLLYGASGVGKTSVLRAGVVGGLRQREDLVVVYFNAWQTEPTAHLKDEVVVEIERATGEGIAISEEMPLSDFLEYCADQVGRRLMVILDQFEEYFLYHPQDDSFASEFPLALTQMLAPASFLVALREDALARLDRFKGHIPTLFDNILRVDHLEEKAARAAIVRPLEKYNALELEEGEPPVEIEPVLVDTVLTKLQAGQVILGEAGRGGLESSKRTPEGRRVETPYLQLVMDRLWREELDGGSSLLRLETLDRLGGPERIVRTHLDTILGDLSSTEQDHAARIFHYLVTPGGAKIAHTAPDLAALSELPPTNVEPLLERLAQPTVRILRTVAPPPGQPVLSRYEIFHDVLAPAVLDWRARFMERKQVADAVLEAEEAARQQSQKQRSIFLTIGLVIALVLGLVAILGWRDANLAANNASTQEAFAVDQANKANTQEAVALEQANNASTQQAIALEQADIASTQSANADASALEASNQRATAQAERDLAATAQAEAENQLQIIQVGELSVHVLVQMEDNHDLAMLLGIEAFTAVPSLQTRQALYAVWRHNPQLLRILQGHSARVGIVAFSPDGAVLASGSDDGTVRLWDGDVHSPAFGLQLGELLAGFGDVNSVAFSPDGNTLAFQLGDGTFRLWDVEVGSPTFGEPLGRLPRGLSSRVTSLAFSPDGRALATGSGDGTVRLWDVEVGSPTFGEPLELAGHTSRVTSVAFSPSGSTLASGSCASRGALGVCEEGEIRLWNVVVGSRTFGGLRVEPLSGHTDWVTSVAFSPDGSTLASGSWDTTIHLWDVWVGSRSFGRALGEPLAGHTTSVLSVAFSPDGARLASGSADDTVRLWDVEDADSPTFGDQLGEPLVGHAGDVISVAFSPDGSTLTSGSDDNTIRLWDVEVGPPTFGGPLGELLAGHRGLIEGVAFSSDGSMLASGSEDETIRLWDADVDSPMFGEPIGEPLRGHTDRVTSVAFSTDGSTLASGSWDDTIRLWDVEAGSPTFGEPLGEPLTAHTDFVRSVAFSPDGRTLVSGSGDETIRLWDADVNSPTFGEQLGKPLSGGANRVFSVAFSPDGSTLASGSEDGGVRLWDVEVGSPTFGELLELAGHADWVWSVAFSPDGRTLASGSDDATILLWDVDVGSPTFGEQLGEPLAGHTDSVYSVAFSPDGRALASGSTDNSIRLWDLQSGGTLGEPLTGHTGLIWSVAFSPDGLLLASGSNDSTVRLWAADPLLWIQTSCQRAGRNLTETEWNQFLFWKGPVGPDYRTCPQWPASP